MQCVLQFVIFRVDVAALSQQFSNCVNTFMLDAHKKWGKFHSALAFEYLAEGSKGDIVKSGGKII